MNRQMKRVQVIGKPAELDCSVEQDKAFTPLPSAVGFDVVD